MPYALLTLLSVTPETGYGANKTRPESFYCDFTDLAVIAKVTNSESFDHPRPDISTASIISFQIESVITGDEPELLRFVIEGGVLDGIRTYVPGDLPGRVGARYFLMLGVVPEGFHGLRPEDYPYPEDTDYVVLGWHALRPNAPLPPQADLQSIWAEHCSPGSGGPNAMPLSDRYLPLVPEPLRSGLIQYCDHYTPKEHPPFTPKPGPTAPQETPAPPGSPATPGTKR